MADRLVEVRNALAAAIAARIGNAATVHTNWTFTLNTEDTPRPTGRVVFVEGVSDAGIGAAARGLELNAFLIRVQVLEFYPGPAPVPSDWVDERCDWVAQHINVFGNPRLPKLLGSLWPETSVRTVACDREALITQSLFWSEIEFTFRETAEPPV